MNKETNNESAAQANNDSKKAYNAPTLRQYGVITSLVNNGFSIGSDAGGTGDFGS